MEMATEIHGIGQGEDHKQISRAHMDKELKETREEMEKLMLKMHQVEQGGWRYEWPLRRRAHG
jgi:hypothetical protein